jgi:hypothetical protein
VSCVNDEVSCGSLGGRDLGDVVVLCGILEWCAVEAGSSDENLLYAGLECCPGAELMAGLLIATETWVVACVGCVWLVVGCVLA